MAAWPHQHKPIFNYSPCVATGRAEHCEWTPPPPTPPHPTSSQLYFSPFDGNKKKIQQHDIIKSPLPHGGSTALRQARPPRDSKNDPVAFWEFVSMGRIQFCGRGWFDSLHLETSTLWHLHPTDLMFCPSPSTMKLPKPKFSNARRVHFEKLPRCDLCKPYFTELLLNQSFLWKSHLTPSIMCWWRRNLIFFPITLKLT